MIDRRLFLQSMLALGMAPAIVRASSLMRVRAPLPREIAFGYATVHPETNVLLHGGAGHNLTMTVSGACERLIFPYHDMIEVISSFDDVRRSVPGLIGTQTYAPSGEIDLATGRQIWTPGGESNYLAGLPPLPRGNQS